MSMLHFTLCARSCRLLVTRISGPGSTKCSRLVKSKEPWPSVEIQHFPPTPNKESEYPGLPPVRVRPCTQSPCARCEGRQSTAGLRFSWSHTDCSPASVGSLSWNARRLSRAQVAAAWSGLYPEQVLPIHADRMPAGRLSRGMFGGLGGLGTQGATWREPAFERVSFAAERRLSDECRAGRALYYGMVGRD